MRQVNWFERKFDFHSDQNIMPSVIERLAGTPIRLAEKLKGIDPSLYTFKPGNAWSILEHVGHLGDLEPLWQGRMDDIRRGREMLRPTDLNNTKTHEAHHNEKSAIELLKGFTALREATVKELEGLNEGEIFKSALHPRLHTPMRMLDLFVFVAEHDDHHLAKITDIVKRA